MLRGKDVQELKDLQRQGMSIQAISELTGWDRKTIRKYMQAAGLAPEYGPRSAPPGKLDAFKPYLEHRDPREATLQREEIDSARRARTEKGHKKGH